MAYYYDDPTVKPLYRGAQIIWYILYLIEVILVFRFFLKFLAANPAAPFTKLVYDISQPLAGPFLYVIPSQSINGQIVEWSTLLAMIVYWVVAWAIIKLFVMSRPISTVEAHERLEDQDVDRI